jgi:hypothetical protein
VFVPVFYVHNRVGADSWKKLLCGEAPWLEIYEWNLLILLLFTSWCCCLAHFPFTKMLRKKNYKLSRFTIWCMQDVENIAPRERAIICKMVEKKLLKLFYSRFFWNFWWLISNILLYFHQKLPRFIITTLYNLFLCILSTIWMRFLINSFNGSLEKEGDSCYWTRSDQVLATFCNDLQLEFIIAYLTSLFSQPLFLYCTSFIIVCIKLLMNEIESHCVTFLISCLKFNWSYRTANGAIW